MNTNPSVTYTAPIAISFAGQYGAVYGKPVLSAATSLSVSVTVEKNGKGNKKNELIDLAIDKVRQHLKIHNIQNSIEQLSYSVIYSSPIEPYYFDHAVCVAATAAVYEVLSGIQPEKQLINDLSYAIYRKWSKLDLGYLTSTSVYGGLVYFRKEFDFLKSISRLNMKIPPQIQEHIYIYNQTDLNLVIKKQYNQHPEQIETILNTIEKNTKKIIVACIKEDTKMFIDSLQANETLLQDFITTSSPKKILVASYRSSIDAIPFHLDLEGLRRLSL